MTKKKSNPGKVVWLILLCLGIAVINVNNSEALPLKLTGTDVNAKYPAARVSFDGSSFGNYLTDYEFTADQLTDPGEYLEAFCIETAHVDNGKLYELVTLSEYYWNPAHKVNVDEAAAIASAYFSGKDQDWTKRATQIAIWEVVFDPVVDLTAGDFLLEFNPSRDSLKLTDAEIADLKEIFDGLAGFKIASSTMVARSPQGITGPGVSQDYLISVPDASVMLLLGPALFGLGLLGRRRKSKK